ncbi:MAG TPA: hypothetical protein VFU57_06205 [Candidatus Acidoferrales bacterium]|nr:hypothetical protein [Candidatus Acidoferrales bacterium]
MSNETKKVLEMLAAGKISQEDAERLLDRLSGAGSASAKQPPNVQPTAGAKNASETPRPRFLRIQVERPGRDDVNVRVPLSLARGGRHWMAFLPTGVADRLNEYGVHFGRLEEMGDEDLQAALNRINVDITKGNGKRVRIYAE